MSLEQAIANYKHVPATTDGEKYALDWDSVISDDRSKDEIWQDLKQEVRDNVSCTQFLEKSKHGMYCCPFCGSGHGANGSGALKFYPTTNTWVCYACDKKPNGKKNSGDVIDLIMHKYGYSFSEAVRKGLDIAGISEADAIVRTKRGAAAPKKDNADAADNSEDTKEKAVKLEAYFKECAARLCETREVKTDDGEIVQEYVYMDAIGYLAGRGISIDTAVGCGIGFDPVADPAEGGHKAPRIIIPTGETGYTGRSIDPNTPENFIKMCNKDGKQGLFNSDALYRGERCVFVVEGAFDAMSCEEMMHAAVALNSNACGDKLLEQLKKKPAGVSFVVALDNDKKKDTAEKTNRYADELVIALREAGYQAVKYNISGSYKDANEALLGDPEAFRSALVEAESELCHDELTDFFNAITSESYRPTPTGLGFFDTLLGGGVVQQQLILLMAAPGAGKTTLVQQVAEELAAHQKSVVYLNFEMSKEQMLAKALSARLFKKGTKMSANEVLQGYAWTDEQRRAVSAELDSYRRTNNRYIKYNPDKVTTDIGSILDYVNDLGAACKKQGKPAPVLIVDYLQYISCKVKMDTQELIKQAITGLKDYARKYSTNVICISATNRSSNQQGKITMESGRDSSNIEYTGDVVLSLNYYDVEIGEVQPTETEKLSKLQAEQWRRMLIRVLKGRFTQPGRSSRAYFNAEYNRFYGEFDPMPIDGNRKPFPKEKEQGKTF